MVRCEVRVVLTLAIHDVGNMAVVLSRSQHV
jgi:hypothetical protein